MSFYVVRRSSAAALAATGWRKAAADTNDFRGRSSIKSGVATPHYQWWGISLLLTFRIEQERVIKSTYRRTASIKRTVSLC